jgi:protease-4
MKSFFKTFFASLTGVIIGFVLLSIIGFIMFVGMIGSMSSGSSYILKEKTVLKLDLNSGINDRESKSPFDSFLGSSSTGLDDILNSIKKAKENDNIKGIYIKSGGMYSGIASLDAIRDALVDFKESGKFIVAYGDYYGQGTYYLASVADKVIMNPKGHLDWHGLAANIQFSRGMYEKMGVKFQVFKVGTFKSAVEPYIQDQMSDANREQMSSFLNDVWSHLVKNISESRNLPVETLNQYADKHLMFCESDSIVSFGMVDTLMYLPDVEKYLKTLTETEEDDDLRLASVSNMTSVPFKDKKKDKEQIAVLYAEGSIVGDSEKNMFGGNTITAKKYVDELMKLKDDEDVKAVVFRVNSGGGSAYASEQIWHAVTEVKKVKPIVVSMGDYAASGGYYISCAATSIVAEPTTLTGSIGIFGMIPEGEQLAKMMGVTFDEVKTNKHGSLGGVTFGIPFLVSAQSRAFNEEESRLFQKFIEQGYDLFITRCADGRSKTKEEIDAIGQGRVWTGNQALANGLIDKLGGLDVAIKLAAEAAELESYSVSSYPAKTDFMTELLKSSMGGSKVRALKFVMGENEYNQQMIQQSLQTADVQMAVMPERISF